MAVGQASDRRQAATTKTVIYWLASIGVGLGATGAGNGSARAVTRFHPLGSLGPHTVQTYRQVLFTEPGLLSRLLAY
jgi:hypothetical protein